MAIDWTKHRTDLLTGFVKWYALVLAGFIVYLFGPFVKEAWIAGAIPWWTVLFVFAIPAIIILGFWIDGYLKRRKQSRPFSPPVYTSGPFASEQTILTTTPTLNPTELDSIEALRIGLFKDGANVVQEERLQGVTLQNYGPVYHILREGRWEAKGSPDENSNDSFIPNLKRRKLVSFQSTVTSTERSFNFAIKLMNLYGEPLGSGIFSQKDEIAFAFRHRPHWDYIYAAIHWHRNKIEKQVKLSIPTQFDLGVMIRHLNQRPMVQVEIDGKHVFLHKITDDMRSQLAVITWADGAPYDLCFQRISVKTQA